jgi:hypothetical protein
LFIIGDKVKANTKMLSLVVKNLYTNLPMEEVVKIIKQQIGQHVSKLKTKARGHKT